MENKQADNLKVSKVFNEKTIKKGISWFLSISIIALVGIFLYTKTGKTIEIWKELQPLWFITALGLVCLDLLLGGWRNHIFVRYFYPGKSQWISFRANLANIFMGAVTPSQSGGGLAQFYVFYKNGISIGHAVTISFLNWISTIVFFPLSGLIAYYIIRENIPSGFISYLASFGFSVFALLMCVVLVGLFFPHVIGSVVAGIARLLGRINKRWSDKLNAFGDKAKETMVDYRDQCRDLFVKSPWLMGLSFLTTVLLYVNKFFIGYILVLALGIDADVAVVMAVQAIVYLLLYFAPSPGGSGIAELSIAGLMAGVISEDYIGTFTLLQRSFLVFIPAILGSFIVLKEINRDKAEHKNV